MIVPPLRGCKAERASARFQMLLATAFRRWTDAGEILFSRLQPGFSTG
jgi:hypothetical protein